MLPIIKNKVALPLIAGGMAVAGMIGGTAFMVNAQTATPAVSTTVAAAANTSTVVADTPESANDPVDTPAAAGATKQHAPIGGDGVVASVSGTTIVMAEESDEGAGSYTIDASKAAVTVNGTAGTIADIKAGQKIFVDGTTTGTNVVATSVSVGHPGEGKDGANDADGSAAGEASEPASASSTAE